MNKDFDGWNNYKRKLNESNFPPLWKEREIWWASIGINIGHEQDGKNREYNRPILIVKKFNNRLLWGVPLTTQIKDNPYYYKFYFKDLQQCAMLSQLRLYDANRLTRKMGRLDECEFKGIKEVLKSYLE